MKKSIQRQLDARKRRTKKRIDKANWNGQSPMLACPNVKYELAEKTQAIACGGIGVAQQLVRQLGITESINRGCPIFMFHMPYSEADHVLNIAFNLFAGGTCLEHLELRRNDEAYLDALGAQRIPDPRVQFYKTIKEIEARLGDPKVHLHSLLVSGTPSHILSLIWGVSKTQIQDWYIMFQGEDEENVCP